MTILTASWGGKAEHGILTVEAYREGNLLFLTARDCYYDDYYSAGTPWSERVMTRRIDTDGVIVNRHFLYTGILAMGRFVTRDYEFTEKDIKPLF